MEKVIVRDNKARMRASAYLSPILFMFASILFAIPLVFFYAASKGLNNGVEIPVLPALILTIIVEISIVIAVLWYVGALKAPRDLLGLRNFSFKTLMIGPALGLIFFAGLFLLEQIFKAVGVDVGDSDTSSMFADLQGIQKVIVLFAFVSLIVPIAEELVFRGYILGFLLKGYDAEEKAIRTSIVLWSIFYSSLWFAAAHIQGFSSAIDFVVIGWTFLFAVASCILRIKTKSLYPSMAAHSTYNLCSAIALMMM